MRPVQPSNHISKTPKAHGPLMRPVQPSNQISKDAFGRLSVDTTGAAFKPDQQRRLQQTAREYDRCNLQTRSISQRHVPIQQHIQKPETGGGPPDYGLCSPHYHVLFILDHCDVESFVYDDAKVVIHCFHRVSMRGHIWKCIQCVGLRVL